MDDSTSPQISGLAKLSIDRSRRPVGSRRGWIALLAIVSVVAALAGGAAWWYYRTTGTHIVAALSEQPMDVNLLTIPARGSGAASVVLVANGKIVSDRRVNVATKVSGQIVELGVEQGDVVKEGQVLARVEDVIYRAQRDEAAAAVARNTHAITRARAEHDRAKAAVQQAQAAYDFEEYNYGRLQRLQGSSDASEFEFVSANNRHAGAAAALEVARATADSAAAAVQLAGADLDASQATLRMLEKRFDDCAIRAPISGVILERNAQVGDFLAFEGGRGANANAQLVAIADLTLLRVEIDISERDVHRLQAGQAAKITPDADRARTYDGRIMWIDPIGDYAKATVGVKVRVLEPGPDLRVEGSAKVEFLSSEDAEGGKIGSPSNSSGTIAGGNLWLPKKAVKLTPGSDAAEVFTVSNERAVVHRITLGTRTDLSVEVLSGVQPGMQIIADNASEVSPGRSVRVVRTLRLDEL